MPCATGIGRRIGQVITFQGLDRCRHTGLLRFELGVSLLCGELRALGLGGGDLAIRLCRRGLDCAFSICRCLLRARI